ncbi:MAG: hypothetical protein ABIO39_07185 [Caulobacteraceae bacterium]
MSRRERIAVRAKAVTSDQSANCVIRDRSPGGARLLFADALQLPTQFMLIEEVNGIRREVRLIWAAHLEAGVAFL